MFCCQITVDDGGQPLTFRSLLRPRPPAPRGRIQRIAEGYLDLRIARYEVRLEAAMGEARLLHQLREGEAGRAILLEALDRAFEYFLVGRRFVISRVTHRLSFICYASYNTN